MRADPRGHARMKYRRWQAPPIMLDAPEQRFFHAALAERVRMRRGERVFTIGSCFARNVETYLRPHFEVASRVATADVPRDIAALHPRLTADLTVWHRYNVHSILGSFVRALEPETMTGPVLLELGDGTSADPYAGFGAVLPDAQAAQVQRWIDNIVARVSGCRVIIVTLGLSEMWRDRATGRILNAAPPQEAWDAFPGRFEFHVATVAETLAALEELRTLLARHCPADFEIVVTVSPIPLRATFRNADIVVANAASKAILRAAVDEWARAHPAVHYFPSYEMILNSAGPGVWLDDLRHCTIDIIRQVMAVFMTEFIAFDQGPAPAARNARSVETAPGKVC